MYSTVLIIFLVISTYFSTPVVNNVAQVIAIKLPGLDPAKVGDT